jgi:hypothetical protein
MLINTGVRGSVAPFKAHVEAFKSGDAYDPNRFVDPQGYQDKILSYEKIF